jgi:hypothetical protein
VASTECFTGGWFDVGMGHDDARHQRRIDMPALDLDRVAAIIADRCSQWAEQWAGCQPGDVDGS